MPIDHCERPVFEHDRVDVVGDLGELGLQFRPDTAGDQDDDQTIAQVFAKSPVRRGKSAGSGTANLTSPGKFGFPLGFVRALLLIFVERDIYPRCRIWLCLREHISVVSEVGPLTVAPITAPVLARAGAR